MEKRSDLWISCAYRGCSLRLMKRRLTAKSVQTVTGRAAPVLILVSIPVRGFSQILGWVFFFAGIGLVAASLVLLLAVVLPHQRREVREVMAPPPDDSSAAVDN